MAERARIAVRGIVQGVGFRPYVYTLAGSLNLRGYVANTSDGVSIDIEGDEVSEFIKRLPAGAPLLSKIVEISVSSLPVLGYTDFRIVESKDKGRFTLLAPDISVCDDCLGELFDRRNRRYLYPFINCTNCGPRYTITRSVPYDRPNTTMSAFEMCSECLEEYHNPSDRRFHAQPNACARCGPQITLRVMRGGLHWMQKGSAIEETINLLKRGAVVAIKGLGGFHIACDASNEDAVMRLRERKRRSNKPFALMAPDINAVTAFCEVSEEEIKFLSSGRRPIVLLKKRSSNVLPDAVSPNNQCLGFMLPYTPLHYLLFYYPLTPESEFPIPNFNALVMTSGNLSEEPIISDNETALEKLSGIADAFLLHNRDIFMGVDDSVVKVASRKSQVMSKGKGLALETPGESCVTHHASLSFIRRSRGYVPEPIALHSDGPEVIGCGADIKNTFALTKGEFAIQSQHIGDMENYETLLFFEKSLENIKAVYRVNPVAIAHDLHPNYLSTHWALKQGRQPVQPEIPCYGIQHHYAHVGSVMAEKGLSGRVIGVAFDGTGYGIDGNLWGGEFLVADIDGFARAGHLRYIPLPGGKKAVREPWRTAVSYALSAFGGEALERLKAIGFPERFGDDAVKNIIKMCGIRELSPLSSGAGRLFDAVSSILGVCGINTFEGEAAMALESLAADGIDGSYPFDIEEDDNGPGAFIVDFSGTIAGVIADMAGGEDKSGISSRFHNTVSDAVFEGSRKIAAEYGLNDVVLSGGTFQNLYLLNRIAGMLESAGMNVYINEQSPCNDAGVSLGQAYIVRERLKQVEG